MGIGYISLAIDLKLKAATDFRSAEKRHPGISPRVPLSWIKSNGSMRTASATATATTTTTTTAATTAAGVGNIIRGGNPAELKCHADVFADFFLQALQLLLSGEKLTRDRIVKKRLTRCFEFADLSGTQLDTGMLLLMQLLAAFMHTLILKSGCIITEKTLDARLELQKRGIAGNVGTQLTGFSDDGRVF